MPSSPAQYPRRLIEVDLPIREISVPASQEKRVSTRAHVWWSWKPLSASRAEILAASLPDPCDEQCPAEFKSASKAILIELRSTIGGQELDLDQSTVLQRALLHLIGMVAAIEPTASSPVLDAARRLIQAARASGTLGDRNDRPLLVDPFAGSGSIPLEGIRLGMDVVASDLNPVAAFLNEVTLRQVPRLGVRMADTLRDWGLWVSKRVFGKIGDLYPSHPHARPIAYLWLRTAKCMGPDCGATVPLASKLWLSTKGERHALRLRVDKKTRAIDVEVFRPKNISEVGLPTVRLGNMSCPVCDHVTKKDLVRAQLAARHGGVLDARLVCVVTTRSTERGRHFESPSEADFKAIHTAVKRFEVLPPKVGGLAAVPDELIPHERVWKNNPIRVHLYGARSWGDLFSSRQSLAMCAFVEAVRELPTEMQRQGIDEATATATAACLCLAVDRMADHLNSLC